MTSTIIYQIVFLVTAITAGKIDPSLLEAVENNGETEEFPEIIDSISSLDAMNREAKVANMVNSMKTRTSAIQSRLVAVAKSFNLTTEQYWISNVILVKDLTPEKLSRLASAKLKSATKNTATVQWGVSKIGAPEIWNDTRGEGIVVGVAKKYEFLVQRETNEIAKFGQVRQKDNFLNKHMVMGTISSRGVMRLLQVPKKVVAN
ncbi:hypothetical protein Fcan01_23696 [Folsomia candida]|uniref:Uncharacterized protein n=1 Tax=Folsomia candida TaxID=158441 RepID=A0A226D7N0_FOLCA|nr:hypothetical protein Fcan01_23696 [Folsomia candida]